jgi:hypothetical protein
MSADVQSWVALVVVAVAATWLLYRTFAKRKNSGCAGDCACATQKLKQ